MDEIVAPEVLRRIWLQGIVNREWDACLSHGDFMFKRELGGGDVEAVKVEGGGVWEVCGEILEPDSAYVLVCV